MQYTLIYNGQSYDLPKFTLATKEKITKINQQNENTTIADKSKYTDMYKFIVESIGQENADTIFESQKLEEIDLSEITIVYLGITIGYDKPVNDYNNASMQEKINSMNIDKVTNLANSAIAMQNIAKKERFSR